MGAMACDQRRGRAAATGVRGQRASADDEEVARRLDKYGKLSGGEARKVVSNVSSRMKRAADMTNDGDPLRQAVAAAARQPRRRAMR